MNPKLAPNFVPPSEQNEQQHNNKHPHQYPPHHPYDHHHHPMASSIIPNMSPIHPYVLEDLRLSGIDAPLPRTPSISSISEDLGGSEFTSRLEKDASQRGVVGPRIDELLEGAKNDKAFDNPIDKAFDKAIGTEGQGKGLNSKQISQHNSQPCKAATSPETHVNDDTKRTFSFTPTSLPPKRQSIQEQDKDPEPQGITQQEEAQQDLEKEEVSEIELEFNTLTMSLRNGTNDAAANDSKSELDANNPKSLGVEDQSPTPVPHEIPRIPSEFNRPASPISPIVPVDAPFPRLGPKKSDVAPDKINRTAQNFVPLPLEEGEIEYNICNSRNNSITADFDDMNTNSIMNNINIPMNNSIHTPITHNHVVKQKNTNSPYTLDNTLEGARPIIHSADLEEVPVGVTRQARTLSSYQFPTHRLARVMQDESKSPLVIVACGSFSPITYLHLRMFEMAMDSIREQTRFEVIGGYYSPVSDHYRKQGLASARHRVRMCELACERTSSWLMVDAWESLQPGYSPTALVLDHFNHEINIRRAGIATSSGRRKGVKIMLLAGGDLIESMGEPNVWAEKDLHHILGRYGCLIVERTGSDVRSFLLSHDIMYEHRRNVLLIKQLIYNDISSTKVRLFIRRGMSVQYLIPNSVIRYIQDHGLYVNETEPVKQVMNERD